MKYILVDKLTGNIVQSTGNRDFTQDIYRAALFDRAENAEKAAKKMLKRKVLMHNTWFLDHGAGQRPESFFVNQEAKDEMLSKLADNPSLATHYKDYAVQNYDLEVRSLTFTVNP